MKREEEEVQSGRSMSQMIGDRGGEGCGGNEGVT